MKVIWATLAEQRALEAVDYIAQDRPKAAAAWLEELIARVGALDRFPRRGRVVPEIGRATYREIFHAPYRVIYRVDTSRVVVLTLRHWSREKRGTAMDPTTRRVRASRAKTPVEPRDQPGSCTAGIFAR